MADVPPAGYQSSSMIPAAGGTIHAMRGGGGGVPPPGYNSTPLIPQTSTHIKISPFEGGGQQGGDETTFDDEMAKTLAVAAVVSSPEVTPASTDAVTTSTPASTDTVTTAATNTAATTAATTAAVVTAVTAVTAAATSNSPAALKEINLNGRRLTIGAPGTWDATMNVPSTPEYEALQWFGVHKTKRNDLKKEILQALYNGICDTNKPLIMALECEPLRRIIQSLAEIQMGNLMAPARIMSVKAASTDMNEAKLMTFNVFQHLCKAKTAAEYINRSNVDIVCTQEDTDGSKLNNYNEVKACGGGAETERVYMKNNIANNVDCISVPGIEIDNVRTPTRSAVLFSVQGITIANLHLEGGQVTDEKIFTNTAALQAKKLELLEKVLAKHPHIIVGDFNSVYHSDDGKKQKVMEEQYKYFSEVVLKRALNDNDKVIINDWNSAPYELLLKSGYTYAKPDNEDQITNGRGNTIVDTIWYKEDKDLFELKDTTIDTIMKSGDTYDNQSGCEYSDHNPVLTTIVFNNTAEAADAAAKVAADAASDGAAKKMAEGLTTSLATGVTRPPYPSAVSPGVPVVSSEAEESVAKTMSSPITSVEAATVTDTSAVTAALLADAPSPPSNPLPTLEEQQRKKEEADAKLIANATRNKARFDALLRAGQSNPEVKMSELERSIKEQNAADSMFMGLAEKEEKKTELAKQIAVAAVATIISDEANNSVLPHLINNEPNNNDEIPPPPPNNDEVPPPPPSNSKVSPAPSNASVSTRSTNTDSIEAPITSTTSAKSPLERTKNAIKRTMNTKNARANFNKYSEKLNKLTSNLKRKSTPNVRSASNMNFEEGLKEINEAMSSPTLKNDVRYKKYFDQLKRGAPRDSVQFRMKTNGVDPTILNRPNEAVSVAKPVAEPVTKPIPPPIPPRPATPKSLKSLNQQLRNSGVNLSATPPPSTVKSFMSERGVPYNAKKLPKYNSLNKLNNDLLSRIQTNEILQSDIDIRKELTPSIETGLSLIGILLSHADYKLRTMDYTSPTAGPESDKLRKIKRELEDLRVKLQNDRDSLTKRFVANILGVDKDEIESDIRRIESYRNELIETSGGKRCTRKLRTQKKKRHNKRSTQRK
jgi:exonuclease III